MSDRIKFDSIEDALEDIKHGKFVIVVDDEDRENEGDLVIPAQMATPDAVNFMISRGKGLLCVAMEAQRLSDLGLDLMRARQQRGR